MKRILVILRDLHIVRSEMYKYVISFLTLTSDGNKNTRDNKLHAERLTESVSKCRENQKHHVQRLIVNVIPRQMTDYQRTAEN
jgi:hypothetical protein